MAENPEEIKNPSEPVQKVVVTTEPGQKVVIKTNTSDSPPRVVTTNPNTSDSTPRVVTTNPTEPVQVNGLQVWLNTLTTNLGNMFGGWQIRIGLGVSVAIGLVAMLLFVNFFWQHWIAVWGMKSWADRSGAKPIECMIKDTNGDKYVSCTALLNDQVVPLECSASVFNIGCRVNFGAAAAPPLGREIK